MAAETAGHRTPGDDASPPAQGHVEDVARGATGAHRREGQPTRAQATYSRSVLLALRVSPLVEPPEGMPALRDWYGEWEQPGKRRTDQQSSDGGEQLGLMPNYSSTGRDRKYNRRPPEEADEALKAAPMRFNDGSRRFAPSGKNPFGQVSAGAFRPASSDPTDEDFRGTDERRKFDRLPSYGRERDKDRDRDVAPHLSGQYDGAESGRFSRGDSYRPGPTSLPARPSGFSDRDRDRERERARDRVGGGKEREREKEKDLDRFGGRDRLRERARRIAGDEVGVSENGKEREKERGSRIRDGATSTKGDRDRDKNERGERRLDGERERERRSINGSMSDDWRRPSVTGRLDREPRSGGLRERGDLEGERDRDRRRNAPAWMDDDQTSPSGAPAWMDYEPDSAGSARKSFLDGPKSGRRDGVMGGAPPGLGSEGGHVDSIQAFKAQMREKERQEKEKAEAEARTSRLSASEGSEGAVKASASVIQGPPPGLEPKPRSRLMAGLSGDEASDAALADDKLRQTEQEMNSLSLLDNGAVGSPRKASASQEPATDRSPTAESRQAAPDAGDARSASSGGAQVRSSRFAKFFEGKPREAQAAALAAMGMPVPSTDASVAERSASSGVNVAELFKNAERPVQAEPDQETQRAAQESRQQNVTPADVASMQKIMAMLQSSQARITPHDSPQLPAASSSSPPVVAPQPTQGHPSHPSFSGASILEQPAAHTPSPSLGSSHAISWSGPPPSQTVPPPHQRLMGAHQGPHSQMLPHTSTPPSSQPPLQNHPSFHLQQQQVPSGPGVNLANLLQHPMGRPQEMPPMSAPGLSLGRLPSPVPRLGPGSGPPSAHTQGPRFASRDGPPPPGPLHSPFGGPPPPHPDMLPPHLRGLPVGALPPRSSPAPGMPPMSVPAGGLPPGSNFPPFSRPPPGAPGPGLGGPVVGGGGPIPPHLQQQLNMIRQQQQMVIQGQLPGQQGSGGGLVGPGQQQQHPMNHPQQPVQNMPDFGGGLAQQSSFGGLGSAGGPGGPPGVGVPLPPHLQHLIGLHGGGPGGGPGGIPPGAGGPGVPNVNLMALLQRAQGGGPTQ